jgi:TPR repeat protein
VLQAAIKIELKSTAEDPDEQAAARAAYPAERLDGVGLAERLGFAPELLQAYTNSASTNLPLQYVVRAAIDWSRAGMPRPVPEPDLLEMAADLLWAEHPELDVTEETLAAVVATARTPISWSSPGSALLLTTPLSGRVRGYRAHDYLLAADDGQSGRPRLLSERSWNHALERAGAEDAFAIAATALLRHSIPIAIRALEPTAEGGDITAMFFLGELFSKESENAPDALHWYERAYQADYYPALARLVDLLADTRDWAQAEQLAFRALQVGDSDPLLSLVERLGDGGEWNMAERLALRALVVGERDPMTSLAKLHVDVYGWDRAEEWALRLAANNHPQVLTQLVTLLAHPDDYWNGNWNPGGWEERARRLAHRAIDLGDEDATDLLADLQPEDPEEELFWQAVGDGEPFEWAVLAAAAGLTASVPPDEDEWDEEEPRYPEAPADDDEREEEPRVRGLRPGAASDDKGDEERSSWGAVIGKAWYEKERFLT